MYAISLEPQLVASISFANRHFFGPEGILHYFWRVVVFTQDFAFVYRSSITVKPIGLSILTDL